MADLFSMDPGVMEGMVLAYQMAAEDADQQARKYRRLEASWAFKLWYVRHRQQADQPLPWAEAKEKFIERNPEYDDYLRR